jgi:amino acid adenylation domain-containing protein
MNLSLEHQQSVAFDPFAEGELLLTAPATEAQKEIWASVQMGSDANCAYNESQTLRLQGELDLESLKSALQQLVLRHEALRMTLSPDGTSFCIDLAPQIEIQQIDLSKLDAPTRSARVAEIQQQAVGSPFDLEAGPLFRATTIALTDREHLLILTAHHIICDGWSWGVILPDLGKMYSTLSAGTTPELEAAECFSEYAIDRAAASGSTEAIADESYWVEQFAKSIPVVDLPTDRPRPPLRTFDAAREDWDLSPQLLADLKQLGTKSGCSLMTTLLAGFEAWLYRLTGQDDLVVGVLAAGQAESGLYNLVGHCVSLLPLRSQVDGNKSFSDYLQARKSAVLDAYDRQQFTFGSLVQKLAIPRDASRIPLVPIVLNIDRGLESSQLGFEGLTVELYSNPRCYENFELFVNATELAGKMTLECQYNTNLFDAETIRRRMAELETLLTGIVADPSQKIATLPLLPLAERELLAQWNQTQAPFPQDTCIHQLIAAQVERTPKAIAVICEDRQLTYRELDDRANQLAHQLQTLGVCPEVLVGISLDRTTEMLVAILGVLKAGGAYVPIDPTYPQERIAFMLADAQVSVLLTQSHLLAQLPQTPARVVFLDRDPTPASTGKPPDRATPANLAYVIYTSGSTGNPKGVQVPHQGVVNFLTAMQQQPGITAGDVLLSVTTLSFDIAVLELLLPLTVGATTILVTRDVAMDGAALLDEIERHNCLIMQATPATWRIMLAAGWQSSRRLQKILSGGEALSPHLAKQLVERAHEVWNMYGPTETTIWSTCDRIDGDINAKPTIGKPIANTQIQILDAHQQPVPIGIPGEMYISGRGVVRGYLNRPELTAERFIHDPFADIDNQRSYRTGDLARFLANGKIEYLQRIDNQVKFRGFRIELGEIEATIALDPQVREVIAIVREDIADDQKLVAYLVLAPGAEPEQLIPQLRQFLKGKLPEYMVPAILMAIEQMPLTPNGKVDRRALPIPDAARRDLETSYIAPTTPIEQQMTKIWGEILKLDKIGIHDNFFELGGYSLLGTQAIARLRQLFGVDLALRALFELPTIAELANRIETLQWATQSQANAPAATGDFEEGEL